MSTKEEREHWRKEAATTLTDPRVLKLLDEVEELERKNAFLVVQRDEARLAFCEKAHEYQELYDSELGARFSTDPQSAREIAVEEYGEEIAESLYPTGNH